MYFPIWNGVANSFAERAIYPANERLLSNAHSPLAEAIHDGHNVHMRPSVFPSLLLLLAISSCADDEPEWPKIKPRADQIQRLELKLTTENCIGDLFLWERRYAFSADMHRQSPTYGKANPDLIEFRLRRGRADYPIKPAQSVEFPYPGIIDIDDRPGKAAGGEFNTASGELNIEYCGYSRGDS